MAVGGSQMAAEGVEASACESAQWDYLRGEIAWQLTEFRRRRHRDKRKAYGLQLATVTLSSAVTVLLGLRTTDATRAWMLNAALVLGALATVLSASEVFFGHRRLWVLRTSTVRRLETLTRHVEFHTAGPGSWHGAEPGLLERYLAELDAILVEDQRGWQHLRQSPADAEQQPEPARSVGQRVQHRSFGQGL